MPALPQSNLHLDILMGRDETLDVTDFFAGAHQSTFPVSFPDDWTGMESGPPMNIHTEMEKKLRMW